MPAAVEELLGYDSPVRMHIRLVVEDCSVSGLPVKQSDAPVLPPSGAGPRPGCPHSAAGSEEIRPQAIPSSGLEAPRCPKREQNVTSGYADQ